jgi:hypothetical protein
LAISQLAASEFFRGSGEKGLLVVLQNLQPVRDIPSVILTRLGRDAEIAAQEGRSQIEGLSNRTSEAERLRWLAFEFEVS